MGIPKKAKLEVVLPGGIAIYDVSEVLPKPKKPSANRRPPGTKIVRVFFHHSGAYGKDGYDGAKNAVAYVVTNRGFGARPYHFFLARKPDVDEHGNIVIYRMALDEERCWHTGGRCNDEGIGVVWQGNLYPDKTGAPTDAQYKMATALWDWLLTRHNLNLPDGFSFHSESPKWGGHPKEACPGPYVEEWVKTRRGK